MTEETSAERSHDDRILIFRDLLRQLQPGRLLDLATGHGSFALTARQLGWEVTAVDARTTRMPMTAGIEWVQADVREFPTDGYDVITIFGLLYHLGLQDQIDLLRRCSSTLTLIDTHVSATPRSMIDGYLGHFFEELQEDPRASWGNPLSFWPTEESLGRMLLVSGYSAIHKIVPPPVASDRTFYIASRDRLSEMDALAGRFNEVNDYRVERYMAGVTVTSTAGQDEGVDRQASRLRRERDAALSRLDRLERRKSVRIALRAAALAKPAYRAVRGDEEEIGDTT